LQVGHIETQNQRVADGHRPYRDEISGRIAILAVPLVVEK
jgi:hypothetical protein